MLLAVAAFLLLPGLPPAAHAATDLSDPDAAVKAGQDALRSQASTPWYDRQADGYQPISMPPKSNWNSDWLSWLFNGFGSLGEVLKFLMWIAIAALAVWILVAMLRVWQQNARLQAAAPLADDNAGQHISRVEALPVAIDKGATDLIAEARRLAGKGDFGAAIVYLFGHQLVRADAADALRLRKGKTNRQYLRELRRNRSEEPRLSSLLERTTLAFERAFFGDHPPTAEEFSICLAGAEQYEDLLQTPPPQGGAA